MARRIGSASFSRLLGTWRPPDDRGLAVALADRVRLLILDGRLALGTRIPAERELAAALDVSRTTVAAAYETLRTDGYLDSRRGSGSVTRVPTPAGGDPLEPETPFSPLVGGTLLDLAHAALSAPTDALRRAAADAVVELDGHLGGHGYSLAGTPELRRAVAHRFTARGVPTTPDQILVTTGAQNAIALLMSLFTNPGDRVLVEHPTYPNALDAIRARGARPVPVPLTSTGWDLELLRETVRDANPALIYLVPDFHNPTGAVMAPADRAAVVDLARRTRTPLVVDETLTELPLDVPPPTPVAAGAPESPLVITIGSASKVFWGGLRIGWIRAAAPLVRRLAGLRPAVDLGGAVLDQLVTARLLDDVESVVAERQQDLRAARADLRAGLARAFPDWRPNHPSGGLSLWVDLGEPVSSRLAGAARRHGLLLAAGPRFGVDGAFERHLRLPFTLRPDRMAEALDQLTAAWQGLDHQPETGADEAIAVA
ncbi:PLP-dependent aminotransferase family protein [Pseudonocardia sp. WMMC193]|uniref:MocR-like transcription factor YczR n=1 Tax=Pseudonocardia sp. WMMC193 TaxID=2911965 RepID=UPI001F23CBFB|nr:PLP-dependent aminotransferase family protein [Pseudonocardia sp. WMMC193]MCF7553081.1 PLP-dependent aminotransferase family protein [Pseudonocardia sp. WMMC193]